MSEKSKMIKVRQEYIASLKKNMLGPGSEISIPDAEHEIIMSRPEKRYSIGVLFPQNNDVVVDNMELAFNIDENEEGISTKNDNKLMDLKSKENLSFMENPEESIDEDVGLSAQNKPSSIGITFFVRGNSDKVKCNIKFATYKKIKASECIAPFDVGDNIEYKLPEILQDKIIIDKEKKVVKFKNGGISKENLSNIKDNVEIKNDVLNISNSLNILERELSYGYIRNPHDICVELHFDEKEYVDNHKNIDDTKLKVTALRKKIKDDVYSVTIMLVLDDNRESKSEYCVFQPEISISTKDNDFVFVENISQADLSTVNDEEKSIMLQYRNKKNYGSGLGVAVDWNINLKGEGKIFSNAFPEVEIPSMDFNLKSDSKSLEDAMSMKYLSDLTDEDFILKKSKLECLVNKYISWIDDKEREISDIIPELKDIAEKNIKGCRESAQRMINGLDVLINDKNAQDAFQLANRAMFMQRAHLKMQRAFSDKERYYDDEGLGKALKEINYRTIDQVYEDKYAWRPFQIAFLIMSIPSIVYENSDDRDLVDLIWFPTGGGKTEAYLGLTAFTIFYRRLKNLNSSGGTAVIMRYTLRLLAAQQFTRAATLICACEYIRDDAMSKRPEYGKYPLGKERITIGLWIGSDHTPNKNSEAKKELDFLSNAKKSTLEYNKDYHNKFQVLKCPWCGTKLVKDVVEGEIKGEFGYEMKNNKHFQICCRNEECAFNEMDSLPIQIVDEELYDNPPTLLFGTVDKFAMLPWNSQIGNFFGCDTNNRAPELIIQDELHLISGPLGTMTGLYETIIDTLCKNKGVSPKIIASTATIRKAKEQCASLYNRKINQFPHPCLDAEDSFFAREAKIDYENEVYGRKYVGLIPSGERKIQMEVKTISHLLQNSYLMDIDEEVKDKYWTTTTYFNSLKELGKCSTLINDDIKAYISTISKKCNNTGYPRNVYNVDELTSRVTTTQLNKTLDKLEKLSYSLENRKNHRYATDLLLATNMISVGIDVARLNIMLMVGQPKLTSEYIQASSRVGREFPGVVFTMYDSTKSRDRSHFEQFKSYHEAFYKYVEPTGITPFSKPARDRALHAIIFSLMRYKFPELKGDKDAINFSFEDYEEAIEEISDIILKRNKGIINKTNPDMNTDEDIIKKEIINIFRQWDDITSNEELTNVYYGNRFINENAYPEKGDEILMKTYKSDKSKQAYETMTSMRNVDASVGGSIIIWKE